MIVASGRLVRKGGFVLKSVCFYDMRSFYGLRETVTNFVGSDESTVACSAKDGTIGVIDVRRFDICCFGILWEFIASDRAVLTVIAYESVNANAIFTLRFLKT